MREARFVVPSQDTTDFVIAMPALKEVPVVITDTVGIAVQGRISLRYAETRTNGSAAGGFTITPQPDGKFTILMSEGDRRLTIDLPNYKIQSLTYGSTDLMKENMRVTNADTAELRIVVERTIVAIASPQSAQAADPRREKLDTAISEAVRLLESNEYVAFLERYMAPQELERLKERPLQEFAQRFGEDKAPRLLRVLKMITGTTPTLDPDGTKAVYQLSDPIEGKSSITFFKVDKYWYIAN
jgi:hypothetical protein